MDIINLVAPADGVHKETCSHCGSEYIVKDEVVLWTAPFHPSWEELISELHVYGHMFLPSQFGIDKAGDLIPKISEAHCALGNFINNAVPLQQRYVPLARKLYARLEHLLNGCLKHPYALIQVVR